MFKSVTILFEEEAVIVINAASDDEARAYVAETFSHIPGLEIKSIEDTPEDHVAELQQKRKELN